MDGVDQVLGRAILYIVFNVVVVEAARYVASFLLIASGTTEVW